MTATLGWRSRGYLPHFHSGVHLQLITYRLADALPHEAVLKLGQLASDSIAHRKALEKYLDAGSGSCVLGLEACALAVENGWLHFAGVRYWLHAWVVMPNHVHVLIEPITPWLISGIVHSQKSYTAKRILALNAGGTPALPGQTANRNAGGTPALPGQTCDGRRVWQPEYFDRFIRDENHYHRAIDYIHQNPVAAGLVAQAQNWKWSSAARPGRAGVPPASVL